MFRLTSTILVITLSLLAATCVNALECGGRTCLNGEQCCADFMMGSTCFNPADHTCASSNMAAGDSGYRLCGLNEGACGSACYDKNNYFCCNGQLQQNGQACAGQTNAPTSAPATVAPTTPVTQSPPQNNCPGANNFGGVNCSDASLCCGYGTITPSCLPADGSKKCCVHFKAATQCNQEQVCGGSGGPGASSYAACGPAGTTFCDKGTGQGTFCAQDKPTCCGYYSGYGFCCPEGCACNNNYYNCSCPSTATVPATTVPATTAPTDAPTSAPVTTSPTQTSSSGLVCGSRTCLAGEQCCNDFVMGSTCYNPSGYSCAATTSSSGAAGSRLCGSNEGACGSVCFDQSNYQCCNGQLQQKGQTCSGATNAPTNAPTSSPTNSPTSAVTQAPLRNNCPGANNFGGVNCSDASLCCGYGTITPSCLPADGSKKCCVHFKASTQCNQDQVCGGSGGPGASSYASCGAPGTTFCDKGTGQGTFCAQDKPLCCGYSSGFGFCCPEGCACNNNYYNCSCPSTTTVPATTAPTDAPTDAPTSAPVTASPLPTAGPLACGGRTCLVGDLCCNDFVRGETCYDPSGYQCAATNSASTGASGSLLCANNQGACGSVCYDKSNYYCCNNELRQNGQPCSA